MTTVAATPFPEPKSDAAEDPITQPVSSTFQSLSAAVKRAVPAWQELHMGRAASLDAGVNWLTLAVLVVFHLGAVTALFFFTWQRLTVMAILYVLAINVGIGMCYHRLLTHRGYQVPKWIEHAMAVCATLSLEGGPIFWVATHRVHHQLSDQHGDPHTPREGGWWAHTGWLIWGSALHAQTEVLQRYAPDLSRDRFYLWLSKYHWIPLVASGGLLFGLGWIWGGWENAVGMLLWGAFLRVTLGLHATWLVNSATHLWGSRRFQTRDDSRNNWWVALVSGGEGWHNNHHANPVSARHGLAWYEIDPNYWGIWLLSKLGLARKIQVAKLDRVKPKSAR
jgi:stearoyl-CoA desaturase (delta-9 desaturase)